MLTLYASGPNFGLPDASPFVIKAELLLKLARLPFQRGKMSFSKAPKGKIPYLGDAGRLIADSYFIQGHLERQHGADFSGGYGARQLAIGWAASRMMEEHFYFLNVHQRWMDDANFNAGPRVFFDVAPAPVRPLVRTLIRRRVRRMLHGQGLGRHSQQELAELAVGDVESVAAILVDQRYLLGDRVSSADAGVFPFLWSGSCALFKGPVGEAVRSNDVAYSYVRRMIGEFFPDYAGG
jgi:glutathione S-transferase